MGNDFIYQNKVYSYPVDKVINEVDDSGAGDAFFSVIIDDWLKNKEKLNAKKFKKWVDDTKKLVESVLTLIGSRTHIKKMYLVEKEDICVGDDKNE